MLRRKASIQTLGEVSSSEKRAIIQKLNEAPEYVPCEDCCSFDDATEICGIYGTPVDPYIHMYGCGKGEVDVPF